MARALRSKKKGARRPATVGASLIVTLRISQALSDKVDAWAKQGDTRSEAMRQLIEAGLARKGKR
jgi:hypothetical protein